MRRGLRILLAALPALSAWPAAAQEDAERLAACLEANPALDASDQFGACADTIVEPCLAGTTETTLDISECVQRETQAWDTLLNRYWKPLKQDAEQAGIFGSLLTAQRAWLAFRDAECAYAYDEFRDGTYRVIAGAYCHRDLTAQRAIAFFGRTAR